MKGTLGSLSCTNKAVVFWSVGVESRTKKPPLVNVTVSLTVMGILDLSHKHRLPLCGSCVMFPPGLVSGLWTACALMEGPKWYRCHSKWSFNRKLTESENHSYANEKEGKRIVSSWNTYVTPLKVCTQCQTHISWLCNFTCLHFRIECENKLVQIITKLLS